VSPYYLAHLGNALIQLTLEALGILNGLPKLLDFRIHQNGSLAGQAAPSRTDFEESDPVLNPIILPRALYPLSQL
jgi:hypothetical protein